MTSFLKCVIYLLLNGIIIFLIGRAFPRKFIKENSFPFISFKKERNGKIYEKLGIKKWKTKLPDASVIFYKLLLNFMPIKDLKIIQKIKLKY